MMLLTLGLNVLLQHLDGYPATRTNIVRTIPKHRLTIVPPKMTSKLFPNHATGDRFQVVDELGEVKLGIVAKQQVDMICFTVELYQLATPSLAEVYSKVYRDAKNPH